MVCVWVGGEVSSHATIPTESVVLHFHREQHHPGSLLSHRPLDHTESWMQQIGSGTKEAVSLPKASITAVNRRITHTQIPY